MYLEQEFLLELKEKLLNVAINIYVEKDKEANLEEFVDDFLAPQIEEAIDTYLGECLQWKKQ